MSAADLLIWGFAIHLLVDWLGQNDCIARRKVNLRDWPGYVHAGMHGAAQLLIFPWWAALFIGVTHLLIDTRKPVAWWSKLIRQTQPGDLAPTLATQGEGKPDREMVTTLDFPIYDIGTDVRIWADQVWHLGIVVIAALVTA